MPCQLSAVVRLQHQFVKGVGVAVAVVEDQIACGVGADGQAEERSGGLVAALPPAGVWPLPVAICA
jgi:hypothetical protein